MVIGRHGQHAYTQRLHAKRRLDNLIDSLPLCWRGTLEITKSHTTELIIGCLVLWCISALLDRVQQEGGFGLLDVLRQSLRRHCAVWHAACLSAGIASGLPAIS